MPSFEWTSGITMAGSGIAWIDAVFNACVHGLLALAGLFGVTYEEINVYGVFILAVLLPVLGATILIQAWVNNCLRRRLRELVVARSG